MEARKIIVHDVVDIRTVVPSVGDRLKVYDLSHFINDDNAIFYIDEDGNKRYADIAAVAKMLNCSVEIAGKFIRRMCKVGVYKKTKEKIRNSNVIKIYINPLYFQVGEYVSLELYEMFEDYLSEYTPKDMREFYTVMRDNRNSGIIGCDDE